MNDLGFDIRNALAWFPRERETPYILVRVSNESANSWPQALGIAVRRCYAPDTWLSDRARTLGLEQLEVLAAQLPDPGSIMAGDFGEILAYFYLAVTEHPQVAFGPKKWRLKEARTKPAPYSDVVQFVLPSWPIASAEDTILCAETKMKATSSTRSPIKDSIVGCAKDRTSRLAKTLTWLRDRAIGEDLGNVQTAHLNRFINAIDYPQKAKKRFYAVAIICSSLVDAEIVANAPTATSQDFSVVIVSVPGLRNIYMSVFEAASQSAAPLEPQAQSNQ